MSTLENRLHFTGNFPAWTSLVRSRASGKSVGSTPCERNDLLASAFIGLPTREVGIESLGGDTSWGGGVCESFSKGSSAGLLGAEACCGAFYLGSGAKPRRWFLMAALRPFSLHGSCEKSPCSKGRKEVTHTGCAHCLHCPPESLRRMHLQRLFFSLALCFGNRQLFFAHLMEKAARMDLEVKRAAREDATRGRQGLFLAFNFFHHHRKSGGRRLGDPRGPELFSAAWARSEGPSSGSSGDGVAVLSCECVTLPLHPRAWAGRRHASRRRESCHGCC